MVVACVVRPPEKPDSGSTRADAPDPFPRSSSHRAFEPSPDTLGRCRRCQTHTGSHSHARHETHLLPEAHPLSHVLFLFKVQYTLER